MRKFVRLFRRILKNLWIKQKETVERMVRKHGSNDILIVDEVGSFTKGLPKAFSEYEVRFTKKFIPGMLAKAYFFEWCDRNLVNASQRRLPGRVVCRIHRYSAYTRNIYKVNWLNVNHLIFTSKHIRDYVATRVLNLPSHSIIHGGIDLGRMTYRKRKMGKELALAGYLNPRKNPLLALEILNKSGDDTRLHIAGEWQDKALREVCEAYIIRHKLKKRVIFYGWQEDINAWLEDKNILLSTAWSEGISYVVLEAMAKGIRPLVYRWVGCEELGLNEQDYFDSAEEAAMVIRGERGEYNSEYYRKVIETEFNQVQEHKAIRALLLDNKE